MGGGFCEKHGPYDPPHSTCPFCAQEDALRRAYGPPSESMPEMTRRSGVLVPPAPDRDQEPPVHDQAEEPEFVRRTVEQDSAEDAEVHEPDPPTEDDLTQVALGQFPDAAVGELDEIEDPSWIEQRPEPLGWLIVKWPTEQRGEILPVRANQIIGRQGDIRWEDARLSRQHARFTFEPAEHLPEAGPVFHLWPFGPTNPVAINGQLIRGATPVYDNDEIHLGDTLFVFKTLLD